jgi:ParB family chromosome partitioning protein
MNTKEAVKSLPEYVNVPLAELVESSTKPRKTFDDERLEELAESIRSKGVLSPLLARGVNGHFEVVSGAGRYRAAKSAALLEVPVRIVALTDAEALETQIIENIQMADERPFEEAQGFRTLLEREEVGYTVEKIAAKTGKADAHIAKRLRLLGSIPTVADAFTARRIGIEHALLIAKLGANVQEEALRRCFDGYYGRIGYGSHTPKKFTQRDLKSLSDLFNVDKRKVALPALDPTHVCPI